MRADYKLFKQNVDASKITSIFDYYKITYADHDMWGR